MEILNRISECLEQGDDEEVDKLTRAAVDSNLDPRDILDNGLIAGMAVVGEKFGAHEIFLPDVLLAARAMHAGMDVIKPLLLNEGIPSQGRIVIGTVQGDLHDIGKNLVGVMLQGSGFEVVDLGSDVSPEQFVDAAREADAAVIGMSALLTTTMPVMGRVVTLLAEQGLKGKIRTLVGGAPMTEAFAREIGADAFGYDATSAVERAKGLMHVS
jgi:5-methyltetrahydrofolate--homocysteine methyltransferase